MFKENVMYCGKIEGILFLSHQPQEHFIPSPSINSLVMQFSFKQIYPIDLFPPPFVFLFLFLFKGLRLNNFLSPSSLRLSSVI